ncbi:tyrosine-type recombinase/integrase [Pseudoalteromonas luteoviolacea]|uniref:tyrosine-type recombinase/integrase n=1 Tax=Pseudoalteromonas luteoviolacea TaxID=43657 RepID=UPI001B392F49|nr:tyrosine-type recombinase/integrase [Pseudoalteromonas luteoviolacea]MBQ4838800.1 tyrosine-type recombinase/integrase [Pseudoalteromonas luteoviolacea]
MAKIVLSDSAISKLEIPISKRDFTATFIGFTGLQLYLRWAKSSVQPQSLDKLGRKASTVFNWRFRYQKPNTKQRTSVSLGYYPEIDIEAVQVEHNRLSNLLREGRDPQLVLLEEKVRAKNVQSLVDGFTRRSSVNNVFMRFKEDWPLTGGSDRAFRNYELSYEKYILPAWNARDMKSIAPREWDEFVLNLANIEGKKGAAEAVHKTMRRLYSYAVEKDILASNPLFGRKAVLPNIATSPDESYLESEDVHKLLNELSAQDCPSWLELLINLMLRVGVRSEEWTRVKLGWFNFQKMRIEHPPESMKNGKKAWTHLPENVIKMVLTHLEELKAQYGELDKEMYLFHVPGEPFIQVKRDYFSRNVKYLQGWLMFTPKMFRKTISTHLQEKGAPTEVLRAIRNQTLSKGVGKHYEFGDLFQLKKTWVERWQDILEEVKADPSALISDKESHLNDELASKVSDIFG